MLWIIGGLLAQMALLRVAGFSIATGVLFALTARGFGRGPLWKSLPIGVVFAFVIYVVFARGLQLSLPAGPLEDLLP
jgi:putative tricarboxylic transport membrane protein